MAMTKAERAAHCRQIAMKGGLATKMKYCGPSGATGYYSEIGKLGFQSYADKHHDGNRAAAVGALKQMRNPHRNTAQPGPFEPMQIKARQAREGRVA